MFTGDLAYLCSLAGIKESKLIKYAQMQAIWNDLSIIAHDNNRGILNKNSGRKHVRSQRKDSYIETYYKDEYIISLTINSNH